MPSLLHPTRTPLFLASTAGDGRIKEPLQYTAAGTISFISSSSQF
jgi:hypothetical protein